MKWISYLKKRKEFFLALFLVFFVSSCSNQVYTDNEPEKIVQAYFEAWDKNDYAEMYALISDGFKEIEPTAETMEDFTAYAQSQNIESVTFNSLTLISNDGEEALVEYEVTFTISGKEFPFSSSYSLKYKKDDKIPGWKLIHPYGENIDTS